ncbi:MAG: hypothetical protein EOP04_22705 [Proteobacteria bacterium]|nr:MAG: hypothetical protein EOP04_22705 [Pseudomonadota bacterium]
MERDAQESATRPSPNIGQDQFRTCTGKNCSGLKPASDFYSKGKRLDAKCKACKLQAKREKYKASKIVADAASDRPLPIRDERVVKRPISVHCKDDQFWNGIYRSALSQGELYEIRKNLSEMMKLLVEDVT